MAKGKVQLASAGSSPIARAVSMGLDIQLFWILEDIGAGEALVTRNGAGIVEPRDLRGKSIAVPTGSTSHFHLLFALEQFGFSTGDVNIRSMQPTSISSSWKAKSIDAAFVWDPVLSEIKESGEVLITSGELSRWGKATFDGLIVDRNWANNNPAFMTAFVKTIAATDASYRENRRAWNSASEPVQKIANLVGGDPRYVPRTLFLYHFPDLKEQASARWLGGGKNGGAARALFYTSKFLLEQNRVQNVLSDYSTVVTDRWVKLAESK